MPISPISLEDIRAAQSFLQGKIVKTPLKACPDAFSLAGSEIFLKFENEQKTGSFKIRGALNKMRTLSDSERKRGVIASSAGNHAQGVAYGAKALGMAAHIVMPESAPMVKINATRALGAEVILRGEVYDEAFAYAKELEREKGYVFVHPFEDPLIIAGQGTIGIEILSEMPDIDTLIVPIGGGGLISGIATAAKAIKPSIHIIGVVSNQAPGMMNMFQNRPVAQAAKRVATIAEGIAVKNPSPLMYQEYIGRLVDDVVEVDDNQIAQAIVFLIEKGKAVVEGAGAAGLAALMTYGEKLRLGKKVCVLLCGGNIDLTVMAKVIERGLRIDHRMARLAVVADDLPGNLNRITTVMAANRANILEVYHDRVSPDLGIRETRIDLLVETASDEHIAQVVADLKKQGFKII